jgi:hypothetical protein
MNAPAFAPFPGSLQPADDSSVARLYGEKFRYSQEALLESV